MSEANAPPYKEFIDCDASEEEGLIFIKVVTMPYQAPVEFTASEACAFAETILEKVRRVEKNFGK